jgi:hypothetical protein
MIEVYSFKSGRYVLQLVIDEENGTVLGSTDLANEFRRRFQLLRDRGIEPADHMDGIKKRLYANYRNFYHWVE